MACSYCGRDIKIAARGLCSACYARQRKNGTTERINAINDGRECAVVGCGKPAHAKGLCFTHYSDADHPVKNIWKLLRSRAGAGSYPPSWDKFSDFLADVGDRPSQKHQLRRIDAALPYDKTNVHWLAPIGAKRKDRWSQEQRPEYMRAWNFRKKFGISVEEYDAMLLAQGNACAVCGKRESHTYKSGKIKSLAIDHDHATGKVRGLLCFNCNQGLGRLQDDIEILRRAIAYLERH